MNDQPESLVCGPQHRICEARVEIPTLCIDDRNDSICVQWNGQPESVLPPNTEIPTGAQFLFPFLLPPEDLQFFVGSLQTCFIPFFGQVKNWPGDERVIQEMIVRAGKGNPDK